MKGNFVTGKTDFSEYARFERESAAFERGTAHHCRIPKGNGQKIDFSIFRFFEGESDRRDLGKGLAPQNAGFEPRKGQKKKKSFFERGNAQSHQFARGFPSGKKRGVGWVRTRAPWCPRPSANQLSQKKHPPDRSWKKVRVFSPNLV